VLLRHAARERSWWWAAIVHLSYCDHLLFEASGRGFDQGD
jgi:hypothetical protein